MIPDPVAADPDLSNWSFFSGHYDKHRVRSGDIFEKRMLFPLKEVRIFFRVIQQPGNGFVTDIVIERFGRSAQVCQAPGAGVFLKRGNIRIPGVLFKILPRQFIICRPLASRHKIHTRLKIL